MHWARAIERNSEALKAILASLFAMLGGAVAARLPRPLHSAVLSVLRPAEAALRRLIIIAARGVTVKPAATRPPPKGPIGKGNGKARRSPFQLFDPRKRFAHQRRRGRRPRILIWNSDPTVAAIWENQRNFGPRPPKPADDGLIDGRRLGQRLQAMKLALDDLPSQARRLVRALARREKVERLRCQW